MNEYNNKIIQNVMFIYLLRLCNYVFPLITVPYLTRVLGNETYGIYSWGNSVNVYFRMFVDFGFIIYGVQAVADCKNDKTKIGEIVYGILAFKLMILIVSFIVLLLLIKNNSVFYQNRWLLFAFFLSTALSICNIDYVFQGVERMQYIAMNTLFTKAIFTAFVFVFVKKPEHCIYVPFYTLAGDLLVLFLMWYVLFKTQGIKPIKCSLKKINIILYKSNWFFLSRILGAIFSSGNIIILGLYCTKAEVAQFSLAYSLIAICQNLVTPIADGIYPHMVKNKNIKLVKKLILIFEPLILLAMLMAFLISPLAIDFIFGQGYELTARIFRILLPILAVSLPGCLFGFPLLSAYGYYREANLAPIVSGIIHALLLVFLNKADQFNVFSVSILTVISEVEVFLIRLFFVRKYRLLRLTLNGNGTQKDKIR